MAPTLRFRLPPSCVLVVQKGDLTLFHGDAIVNAANERMLGGGGVDGAIHRAAGPELLKSCKAVPEVSRGVRCPTGKACVTPGAMLPARHVIHSVGPVYKNAQTSAPLLESTYASCLDAAKKNNFTKIAFPAISCGVYGYPLGEAAEIAVRTCAKFGGTLKEIHFYLVSNEAIRAWQHAAERELQPAD